MITNDKWNVYICHFVLKKTIEGKEHEPVYKIQSVLFQCDNVEKAYHRAKSKIERMHDRYKTPKGEVMSVECLGINDLDILQDSWDEIQSEAQDDSGYTCPSIRATINCDNVDSLLSKKSGLSMYI